MSRTSMLRFADEAAFEAHQKRAHRFYDDPKPALIVPEREISPAVFAALKAHPLIAWVMRQNTRSGYVLNTGVYKKLLASGHIKPSDAQFLRFGFKGAHDYTGQLRDGRRLECEVKRADSKLTDEQQAVQDAVNVAGGLAFTARGVDDVFKALA